MVRDNNRPAIRFEQAIQRTEFKPRRDVTTDDSNVYDWRENQQNEAAVDSMWPTRSK
jgi:hypothetical protein